MLKATASTASRRKTQKLHPQQHSSSTISGTASVRINQTKEEDKKYSGTEGEDEDDEFMSEALQQEIEAIMIQADNILYERQQQQQQQQQQQEQQQASQENKAQQQEHREPPESGTYDGITGTVQAPTLQSVLASAVEATGPRLSSPVPVSVSVSVTLDIVNTSRPLKTLQRCLNKHLILMLHHLGVPLRTFDDMLRYDNT
jgi:hypothetical protein